MDIHLKVRKDNQLKFLRGILIMLFVFFLGGIHAFRYKSTPARARDAGFSLQSLPQAHGMLVPIHLIVFSIDCLLQSNLYNHTNHLVGNSHVKMNLHLVFDRS